MNSIILTGNITKDPELRKTSGGTSVVSATVAVNRTFKDKDGNKQVDYIDFVAWDKKAEYLSSFCRKGDRLELKGRLVSRKYEDRDGNQRTAWEVIVEDITSFNTSKEPREEAKKQPSTPQEIYDDGIDVVSDDLPF